MSSHLVVLGYLVAAVCFFLALRWLSPRLTARQGNLIGMAGMIILVFFTLPAPSALTFLSMVAGFTVTKRILSMSKKKT